MHKTVENFISENYYLLLKIAKRITQGHELSQDLLHEVILQLYDKQEIKLKGYDDNSIKFYITAVMRINWNSKTSPFHYKIRKESAKYDELTENFDIADDQENFEREELLTILEESYAELSWFHKQLLDLYLIMGSMNKVSKSMEIPLTSVQTYIRQAKTQIKTDVNKKLRK
jgi:RNA polymerase sigma factor (sigma-70 family)